jgi:hypothetical protein
MVDRAPPFSDDEYSRVTHETALELTRRNHSVVVFVRPGRPADLSGQQGATSNPLCVIDGIKYIYETTPRRDGKSYEEWVRQATAHFVQMFAVFKPSAVLAASNNIVAVPAMKAARAVDLPFFYDIRAFWELARAQRYPQFALGRHHNEEARRETEAARAAQRIFARTKVVQTELKIRGIPAQKTIYIAEQETTDLSGSNGGQERPAVRSSARAAMVIAREVEAAVRHWRPASPHRMSSQAPKPLPNGNKCKAGLTELVIAQDPETALAEGEALASRGLLTSDEVEECLARGRRHRSFIESKPTILVAGHDLRFVSPFIDYFKRHFHVLIDEWSATNKHNEAQSLSLASRADIIWCEWCCGNAVWYSRHLKPGQKLVVRLHKFEIETAYPAEVDWGAVDSLIFIAPGMRHFANQAHHLPCRQQLLFNGFPVDQVAGAAHKPRDLRALACIGYAPRIKRLDRVLEFYELARRAEPAFTLHLKGKSPRELPWVWKAEHQFFEEQELHMERLRASGATIALSPYDERVHQWIGEKGFLLSASDIEGSHQAVAEAMAAGTIPLIYGDWAAPYQARFLYPNELCFKTTAEAVEFATRLAADPRAYDQLSRRVQTFAHENFDSTTILHGVLDILQGRAPSQPYISITERPRIGVFSDLSLNVIDGSTIWLFSVIECLLQDPNIDVCLISRAGPADLPQTTGFASTGRFRHMFPSETLWPDSPKAYAAFLDRVMGEQQLATVLARVTPDLAEILRQVLPETSLRRLVYYLVGEAYPSRHFLQSVKGILLQTPQSRDRLVEINPALAESVPMAILPPILPGHALPSLVPLEKPLTIAYSGKMSRGYNALEMAQLAARAPDWMRFDLCIAKFYHPDGKDYVAGVKQALNTARATGRVAIHEQLTREEVLQRVRSAHFGWSIRSEAFRDSTEISTKVLEYCALGKPPLLNRFSSNVALLGEEYPLFVEQASEVPGALQSMLEQPALYEQTARYCADKATAYKMESAYHKIISLLLPSPTATTSVRRD